MSGRVPAARLPCSLGWHQTIYRISTVNHLALPNARDASGKYGMHVITPFHFYSDLNNPMC